jgi:hypothetical protein
MNGGALDLHAADPQPNTAENLENNVRVLQKGTSSKAARKAAAEALPLDKLSEENRQRALAVINSTSVFRPPTLEFEVEPKVYEFVRAHPAVAVSIWRAMDISQFQMWQTGREVYEADAGDGSTGVVTVLFVDGPHSIVLCEGIYKSPFLAKPIKATALMHIESVYERRPDNKICVRHGGHLYVNFPSQTVDTAAKIISPVSNLIIDRNFHEVSLFLHMMSLAMARQPGWVEHITGKLEGVLEVRKSQLLDVTAKVYVDTHKRDPKSGETNAALEKIVETLRYSPAAAQDRRKTGTTRIPTETRGSGTNRWRQTADLMWCSHAACARTKAAEPKRETAQITRCGSMSSYVVASVPMDIHQQNRFDIP